MVDEAHWPRAVALIEEVCGARGSSLMLGEGPPTDVRASFVGHYRRGQRLAGLEREYMKLYHPIDEGVSRFRRLPYNLLARHADLYTEKEKRRSTPYNEVHLHALGREALCVKLRGSESYSHITWTACHPVARGGWETGQIAMMEQLLPHIRQLVVFRQALSQAGVPGAVLTDLLDSIRLGVIHLDRRGRVIGANNRAAAMLRCGDALSDRRGTLSAHLPTDRRRLESLLSDALPRHGGIAVAGSMMLRGSPSRHVVHVKPTAAVESDFGGPRVAAVVLIVEPSHGGRIDPKVVASTLGLTSAESRVATWLAEGKTVTEIAADTGRQRRSVYWLLEQIYAKLGVRRQVDLVRLVLSVTEFA